MSGASESSEAEFVVGSELGLHARPAGRLAALARRFEAEIQLGNGQEWVDAGSILSILGLGAAQGARLRVRAIGRDAAAAVAACGELLESAEEPN